MALKMNIAASEDFPVQDPYPTRIDGKGFLIPRRDPVVHGHPDDGPLSAAQLAAYDQNGYLSFEQLFDNNELSSHIAELDRLRSSAEVRREVESVLEPGSNALRSMFAIHKRNALFAGLCEHAKIVAIATQILGSQVYIHQSRVNYKPGFTGKEFYWHSDFETWHAEDGVPAMRMLSCSISLTPNTPHNGPLMIVPGSHKYFLSCQGKTPENNFVTSLRRQEVGVPDDLNLARMVEQNGIISPLGGIGSVTFFDCNVMHGSNSNITPQPRSNVFVVFNSIENTPVAPYCGQAPRPPHIAERRDFTPLHVERNMN